MKKIIAEIKKIEKDTLLVITIMLLLPTGSAVLMKKPLAWVLELVFAAWLFFICIVIIIKTKDK